MDHVAHHYAPANLPTRLEHGLYWVVVDESEEQDIAFRYAARRAAASNAHVALVHVMDKPEFQQWGAIQSRLDGELRLRAEKILSHAARRVYELSGRMSSLYLEEGNRVDVLLRLANGDPRTRALILASSKTPGNPGPLIAHFCNRGLASLNVPLGIIPGTLDEETLDRMSI